MVPFLIALMESALCLVWRVWLFPYARVFSIWGFFLLLLVTAAYGATLVLGSQ